MTRRTCKPDTIECKHPSTRSVWRRLDDGSEVEFMRFCNMALCGVQVGMGKADEKQRVEIAAAGIVAQWEHQGHHYTLTPAEYVGYHHDIFSDRRAGTFGWYAGWLARFIVDHDEPTNEEVTVAVGEILDRLVWAELALVHANPDDRPIATGADHIGLTPRQVREQQAEAERWEAELRVKSTLEKQAAKGDGIAEFLLLRDKETSGNQLATLIETQCAAADAEYNAKLQTMDDVGRAPVDPEQIVGLEAFTPDTGGES